MIRTYSELATFPTFEERLQYLIIGGGVGRETFGYDRYLNQKFYRSREWKDVRQHVIVRDYGCDLGVEGYEIHVEILIHHMNPVSKSEILHRDSSLLNPEYLITTTHRTHNAIHYAKEDPYPSVVSERTPQDTRLW